MGAAASRRRDQQAQPGAAPALAPAPAYAPGSVQPGPHYPPSFQPQGGGYYGPPGGANTFSPGWRPPPGQQPYPPHGSRAGAQPPPQPPPPPQELTKTATIRNSVNLKKNTLQLVPQPGDAQKLLITFAFDNSAPCIVSTFVCATEEPAHGCRINSASQQTAPSIAYDKGLGLKFPKAGAESSHLHVVDLSRHPEAALMAADGNTFPLIIRLETVTERGAKEGHTLKELEPGGAQKQWVQSQTTFASLGKGEDGEYEVRVLKQKIWVDGISYELQEIYGMDQAGGGGGKAELTEAEAEDRLCVICLVNERDTTVLPCRHMCMCHECAQELRKQTQRCPICRNPVESLLHIRLGTKGAAGAVPVGGGTSTKGASAEATAAPATESAVAASAPVQG